METEMGSKSPLPCHYSTVSEGNGPPEGSASSSASLLQLTLTLLRGKPGKQQPELCNCSPFAFRAVERGSLPASEAPKAILLLPVLGQRGGATKR